MPNPRPTRKRNASRPAEKKSAVAQRVNFLDTARPNVYSRVDFRPRYRFGPYFGPMKQRGSHLMRNFISIFSAVCVFAFSSSGAAAGPVLVPVLECDGLLQHEAAGTEVASTVLPPVGLVQTHCRVVTKWVGCRDAEACACLNQMLNRDRRVSSIDELLQKGLGVNPLADAETARKPTLEFANASLSASGAPTPLDVEAIEDSCVGGLDLMTVEPISGQPINHESMQPFGFGGPMDTEPARHTIESQTALARKLSLASALYDPRFVNDAGFASSFDSMRILRMLGFAKGSIHGLPTADAFSGMFAVTGEPHAHLHQPKLMSVFDDLVAADVELIPVVPTSSSPFLFESTANLPGIAIDRADRLSAEAFATTVVAGEPLAVYTHQMNSALQFDHNIFGQEGQQAAVDEGASQIGWLE